MNHIKEYRLFESIEKDSFFDSCEKYLQGTSIWEMMRKRVKEINPELLIDYQKSLPVTAQFDLEESTYKSIAILINPKYSKTESTEGTMAHELTHALQFLRDGDIDLFVTDATRAFSSLSKDEIWEDLMLGIYLVDPIEIEAWKSEIEWYESTTLNYMMDWMKRFNPSEYANQLMGIAPLENEWDLESFDNFPSLWSEVYFNYNDGKNIDQTIIDLGNLSLVEFLEYYDRKFKAYKKELGT